MKNLLLRYIRDEEGQTSTEYILLVAVVAMIVFKFKGIAQERLMGITNDVFDQAGSFVNENN